LAAGSSRAAPGVARTQWHLVDDQFRERLWRELPEIIIAQRLFPENIASDRRRIELRRQVRFWSRASCT
jgi:hypothetical protein